MNFSLRNPFKDLFGKKAIDDVDNYDSSVVEVEMKGNKDKVKKDDVKSSEKSNAQLELEESERKTAELRAKMEAEEKAAKTVEGGQVTGEVLIQDIHKMISEVHQMVSMIHTLEVTKASMLERKDPKE